MINSAAIRVTLDCVVLLCGSSWFRRVLLQGLALGSNVHPVLNHVPDADGTDISYADEGSGPMVLIVHGGLSAESAWSKVAAGPRPTSG